MAKGAAAKSIFAPPSKETFGGNGVLPYPEVYLKILFHLVSSLLILETKPLYYVADYSNLQSGDFGYNPEAQDLSHHFQLKKLSLLIGSSRFLELFHLFN